ncbi:hypothetical protein PAL_GLEAN10016159 [Pteropus alecto]|uniref:Uncharacterized protein n=1 Tax=Pteropus alecto TaxID=9402 RepID=L5KSK3_PTEAL|nr:hypothetical protein PAL_GLEAN10016159 [Pteropus alecto]
MLESRKISISTLFKEKRRTKSREHGNAMRKRLFNPPEESEK